MEEAFHYFGFFVEKFCVQLKTNFPKSLLRERETKVAASDAHKLVQALVYLQVHNDHREKI